MARDYAAELRARNERARQRGFQSYAGERQARQLIQAHNVHPTSRFKLRLPEPAHGLQGPFGPSPAPDWDYYWPTRTSWPARSSNKQGPRTLQARYSRDAQTLEVIFRDGTPWHYEEVPEQIWVGFKRNWSPGRFINDVLNNFPYGQGGWGSIVGEG